ncbi:glycine cleavage system aminomethyltransferase GcvT [Pseudofrancisella aestuarii]|uniref:Aminomethyltransferase n=1 Tax=Pseudofrancisella aestuarii TaxID=2670347 RepID=A0ABV9TB99_9GAMM|nr:glycine cleavage system aminomethyltransferase GcvT [Pseudofrancisella aestuarii]
MLKTVLHDTHVSSGAKMVDFSGWEMPINYGSQIAEHNSVREACGIFDVSHMLALDIVGKDTSDFLRYLLANHINKVQANEAQYGCMLNADGGIVDDLIVYKINDNFFRLVINAGNRASDFEWIKQNSSGYDVEITPKENLAIIAVQGPKASEVLSKTLDKAVSERVLSLNPFNFLFHDEWMFARTGYTGEDGFEIAVPRDEAVSFWNDLVANGANPCGLGARDTLRLEAGMHLYGSDMNTSTSPLDRGLGWSVDLKDENRDFIGKSAVLKRKAEGVDTKWVGVVLKSKGVLRAGQQIVFDNGGVGFITSGSFSPTLKYSIALAYVPKEANNPQVVIRDKHLPVEIVKPKFVKNGKSLI